MQAHGPEYGVFHGDIARQQAEAEGKRRLRQILVHKAEQQRRAENGKALAIGLQAAGDGFLSRAAPHNPAKAEDAAVR